MYRHSLGGNVCGCHVRSLFSTVRAMKVSSQSPSTTNTLVDQKETSVDANRPSRSRSFDIAVLYPLYKHQTSNHSDANGRQRTATLAMTGQYEGYLTLLTDLLSPQQLPTGTLTSIAYHIGSLEDAGLANLISAILQSPSLFQDDSDPKASSSSASAASLMNSTLQSDAAIGQTHAVFEAIRQGVLARAANVKAANGTGWSARRKYRKSLEMMLSSAKNNFPLQKPVAALKLAVVSSGTLRALQDLTVKQDKLVSGTGATVVSSITSSTVLALAKAVDCLETSPAVEYTSSGQYRVPLIILTAGVLLKCFSSGVCDDSFHNIICCARHTE